jgi:hypothetical protein
MKDFDNPHGQLNPLRDIGFPFISRGDDLEKCRMIVQLIPELYRLQNQLQSTIGCASGQASQLQDESHNLTIGRAPTCYDDNRRMEQTHKPQIENSNSNDAFRSAETWDRCIHCWGWYTQPEQGCPECDAAKSNLVAAVEEESIRRDETEFTSNRVPEKWERCMLCWGWYTQLDQGCPKCNDVNINRVAAEEHMRGDEAERTAIRDERKRSRVISDVAHSDRFVVDNTYPLREASIPRGQIGVTI